MPICCRNRCAFLRSRVMFAPSKKMSPLSTGSSKLIERSNVDFPEPDGPMMTTVSLAATVILQVFSTCAAPKLLLMPTISRRCSMISPRLSDCERLLSPEHPLGQRHPAHALALLGIEHGFDQHLHAHESRGHRE